MTKESQMPPSEADPAWKTLLDFYFPKLMAFFWPELYQQINWDKGFETLDSELQAVCRQAAIGKRLVDKLFQVYSKQGGPWRVLTHVEVQGQRQSTFEKRLFDYYCRIYVLKGLPLITLVLLIDDDPHWRPQGFEIRIWNQTIIDFKFQSVKILDYRGRETELAQDPNPFAVVVLAQLAALETKQDPQQRFDKRWELTRRLFEKGWAPENIRHLYEFMDWVLTLPKDLELQYNDQVKQFAKEHHMPYITSLERMGFEKGERAALLSLLEEQFPNIPPQEYTEKLNNPEVKAETLLKWIKKVLKAKSLEDVFREEER